MKADKVWLIKLIGFLLLGLFAPISANAGAYKKEFTNSIGMKMVLIPAGEFMMGSAPSGKEGHSREGPRHKVMAIFRENLHSSNTGVKVNAAKFLILPGYKGNDLFPVLREGIDRGDVAVSLDAALVLGSLGGEEAISLLEQGMKSSRLFVAVASARALGKIALRKEEVTQSRRGIRGLFKRELTPLSHIKSALKDETIKEDAAKVLLELGEQDGADFFRERLKRGGSIKEKLEAASLLARSGDKSGTSIVREALENNDSKIRRKAVKALKEFGNRGSGASEESQS